MIKRLFDSLQKSKTPKPAVFDPESVLEIFVPAPGMEKNEPITFITITDLEVAGMHLQDVREVLDNLHNVMPDDESFAKLGLLATPFDDIPKEYQQQYEGEIQKIRNSYVEAGTHYEEGTHTGNVESF